MKKIAVSIVMLVMLIAIGWLAFYATAANQRINDIATFYATAANQRINDIATATNNVTTAAFVSNKETWQHHPELENRAQLELVKDQAKLIRLMIEENFTNYNPEAVALAGNMIHRIGGESAIPIVLEYKNDPRVIVSENVRWWYKQYCPGAIDDRIERLEVKHDINSIEMPPKVQSPRTVRKPSLAPQSAKPADEVEKPKPSMTSSMDPEELEEKETQLRDKVEYLGSKVNDHRMTIINQKAAFDSCETNDPATKAWRRNNIKGWEERLAKTQKELTKAKKDLREFLETQP